MEVLGTFWGCIGLAHGFGDPQDGMLRDAA